MPELPEVEITARRLGSTVRGAEVESALAPGVVAVKTVDPPLAALAGLTLVGVRRIGKMLVVETGGLSLLVHLMSAGRLSLFDKRASARDRSARVLIRLRDGRELRLREFGSRQRAWVKLLRPEQVERDEAVASLGPDAWPAPSQSRFAELVAQSRHLHPLLRDQRVIAGIGRSWVDEVLWAARLSPFRKGSELNAGEIERLRAACDDVLGSALDLYEREIGDHVPDKLPKPFAVHGREGEPCPRCGAPLAAVHFSEHVTTYCPQEQTGGKVLKDRRLSRLLK